jgi:hypothetical protein
MDVTSFDFSAISSNSFWAVPLVVAIVEAFKMSGFNNKFAPLISLVVGLGLSFLVNTDVAIGQIIVSGIIYGLTASGLYSSVKTTANVRGKVPLRTDKEAVVVETFEVEKPLGQTTVKANSDLQVTQTISSSSQADSQSQSQNKSQAQSQPSSQNQSQAESLPQSQSQSQADKPILEQPIESVVIEELNMDGTGK